VTPNAEADVQKVAYIGADMESDPRARAVDVVAGAATRIVL
jgi:hypothetical protein